MGRAALWRPYLGLVAAALLVVALLASSGRDPPGTRSISGGAARTDLGDAIVGEAEPPSAPGNLASGGPQPHYPNGVASAGPDATTVAAPSAGRAAGPGVTGSEPAAATGASARRGGAGVGTAAARAAPDCDSTTGRLRVESIYAPPCVLPWVPGAENGGASSGGVTRDAITVVIYYQPTSPSYAFTPAQSYRQRMEDAAAAFEHSYRLWGRKVRWVFFEGTGSDEVAQRADALKLVELRPFAVVGVQSDYTVLPVELARNGIIVLSNAFVQVADSLHFAPYLWGTVLAPDDLVAVNAAHYVGKRLRGKRAQWAGDTAYQAQPRRFGLIYPDTWDDGGALGAFTREFAASGGQLAAKASYRYGTINAPVWAEQARVITARMKAAGVTSAIAATDVVFTSPLVKAATDQQWFPEWVLTGFGGQDLDLLARTNDALQWRHAFGIGALAVGGSEPAGLRHFCAWYWGTSASSKCGFEQWVFPLFTGIHAAGPNLTPATFRDGLFAFPPSGGAVAGAVMAPQISFGDWGFFSWTNYNAYNDFTEIYWDPTAQGPDTATGQPSVGKYRYLNMGRRYLPLQWPASEPAMFDPANTVVWYETTPQRDATASYPCGRCPSAEGG